MPSITHAEAKRYMALICRGPCGCGRWQGLVHMARTEGVRGMMKGNWTNCVRIIPNSAVKFLTYEQLSR